MNTPERLTPDFTINGRMPTKHEYDISIRMLRAFSLSYKQAHIHYINDPHTLYSTSDIWHPITDYGVVYARQRGV